MIGAALKVYAYRRLPGFGKGMIQSGDMTKHESIDAIVRLREVVSLVASS